MPKQPSSRAMRRAAQRSPRRRRKIGLFPFAIALLLIGGITLIALARQDRAEPPEPPEGVITFPRPLPKSHVEGPVDYATEEPGVVPPVGGPHMGTWMNCGFYDEPVIAEAAVHSLEHAAVWITYDPAIGDDVDVLRGFTRRPKVLVSPWPDPDELPSPVVASAWGAQLPVDSVDDPRLEEFIAFYHQHPGAPEPGGACTGGIGNPQ